MPGLGSKRFGTAVTVLVVGALLVACLALVFAQRRRDAGQQVRARRVGGAQGVVTIKAGGDLQAAIDAANPGDTIILEAGATFSGPFTLRDKGRAANTDADYITIRTSAPAGIPPEGERVRPALHAQAMPKIVAPDGQPAIQTAPRAHHYKFVGVEFAPAARASYVYNLINLGADDYKSPDQFPHHIVFDRCYVRSTGLNKARRGFALNSGETSIINSHVAGFAGVSDETQAIAGWNGPGPFRIVNNYLEGGAQNIMFGGSDPSISGLVPSDIEIRRNHLYKPAGWFGRATIKASLELKNARRVRIDGNVIENGGNVTAFLITVRNQSGSAPWSAIEDVEITNNVVRRANMGVVILGRDDSQRSQQAKRLRIANNLFDNLLPDYSAVFMQINGGDVVTVEHNTVRQAGSIIKSYGEPTTNFVFRDNIVQHNAYGIVCAEKPAKSDALEMLAQCFPRGVFKGNVIADNLNVAANGYPIDRNFPVGNFFVRSYDELGFTAYTRGDWRLSERSRLRGRATDGTNPGVDFNALEAAGAFSAVVDDDSAINNR